MSPFEALDPENKSTVLDNLYSNIEPSTATNKFKVGDRARIRSTKNILRKATLLNGLGKYLLLMKLIALIPQRIN